MYNIYYHNKSKMSLNSHNHDEKQAISLKDLSENGEEKLADLSNEELQQLKQQAIEAEDYDIAKMIKQELIERKERVPETPESIEIDNHTDAEYKAIQQEKITSHEENLKKAEDLITQLNDTPNDDINKKEEIEKITNEISKGFEVSSNQIKNLQQESVEIFSGISEITKEIQNMWEDFRAWKWAIYWSHIVFSGERINSLWYKIKNIEDKFNNWLKYSEETHQRIIAENRKLSENMDLLYNNWNPLIWKKDLNLFENLLNIKDTQNKALTSIEDWIYNSILKNELNVSMLWEVFQWIWLMRSPVIQEILLMLQNIYNNAKFKSNIQDIKYKNSEIKEKINSFWNVIFNKN